MLTTLRCWMFSKLKSRDIPAPVLADFERRLDCTYDLGPDKFRISHGHDYHAFFRRIGLLDYKTVRDSHGIAASCALILRQMDDKSLVWYAGDLKVRPDCRNRHLTSKLIYACLPLGMITLKVFAVEMIGENNVLESKIVRMTKYLRIPTWISCKRLSIYNWTCEEAHRALALINNRVQWSTKFISLQGKKDIVMQSTGQVLPVLHMIRDQSIKAYDIVQDAPQLGYNHMYCCLAADIIALDLSRIGLKPSSSAWIISNAFDSDYRFLSTAEI